MYQLNGRKFNIDERHFLLVKFGDKICYIFDSDIFDLRKPCPLGPNNILKSLPANLNYFQAPLNCKITFKLLFPEQQKKALQLVNIRILDLSGRVQN